jgi:hypothetical protein
MKKWLPIVIAVLVCAAGSFFLFRPARPTIYYQPSSVKPSDIRDIQSLVRARGERHFNYIVFSTVDSNLVQVSVNGGMFHRDRSRLYWIRRVEQTWQIERVDVWEKGPLRM